MSVYLDTSTEGKSGRTRQYSPASRSETGNGCRLLQKTQHSLTHFA